MTLSNTSSQADGFARALSFVLKWEGGYSETPGDLGGATNKGITQGTYSAYRKSKGLPGRPVKELTMGEMHDIYKRGYWDTWETWGLSTAFRLAAFDSAVNMGVGVTGGMLRDSGKDLVKFLNIREARYRRYALVGIQKKFLQGWLNRLNALRKEVLPNA